MEEELIVQAVPKMGEVPTGMGLNPVFDWCPILGIPFWALLAMILFFGCFFVWILWARRCSIFRSVAGWKESVMKAGQGDVQVWVVSRTQKLTIECMSVVDNVLSSHDPRIINMYHINSGSGKITVGNIPGVVVSEDYDQNRDFITECALYYNCNEFNRNNAALKAVLIKEWEKDPNLPRPRVVKQINDAEDYESFGRDCLKTLSPEGLYFPSYSMWDSQAWRKYFFRGCSAGFFGGEMRRDARKLKLPGKQKGFWEAHALLAGAIVIGMIALLVSWLAPIGG